MSNFLLIFLCLGAGMILQRRRDIPSSAALALNLYVIYMALPALVLAQMPKLTFSFDLLVPIVMPWLLLAVGAMLVLTGQRLLGWSREVTGCLLLCVPLGNTSFLGIPMVTAFFGVEGPFWEFGVTAMALIVTYESLTRDSLD